MDLLDTLWVLVAAVLVFFMQAGFAFLESGLTRSKNSINVAIKNLTDLGVSLLCYWVFGFALMFGATVNGWFGSDNFLLTSGGSMFVAAFFIFQAMFCSTAATIVSGAVAERMRYSSYIISTIALAVLIYPIFGHWAWAGGFADDSGGWLARMGFVDFAGSTVVHSVGGWMALAAVVVVGPRSGRFPPGEPPQRIQGSSVPAAVVGVLILWFGWFGFNGGSTLAMNESVALIILNTALGAASGMVFSLAVGWPLYKMPDISLALNGALAGLVAITAPCAFVTELDSVIIGGIGGAAMVGGTFLLERMRIDDAVGAVPVHMVAGVWGTLAVAFFGDPELVGTGLGLWQQLGVQALGVAAAGLWAFGLAYIILSTMNRIRPLRVSAEKERLGLNVSEHGASTEIFDLVSAMEDQERTGDVTKRVPVEPFTEVGQIAAQYNAVLASLDENLIAKSEYLNILDNVSDGLFLIDKEFRISPYYSVSTENIFEEQGLAGKKLTDIVANYLPEDKMKSVGDFLGMLFDPFIDRRTALKLNPLAESEFFFDHGEGELDSKFLRFDFKRVGDDSHVARMMIVVRDVTEQVELNQRMEDTRAQTESDMELFYRILHVDPEMLGGFITDLREDLASVNGELEVSDQSLTDRLERMYRKVHAIKGDASLLSLDLVADKAHEFENEIARLIGKPEKSNADFVQLTISLSELQKTAEQIESMTRRLREFQLAFVRNNLSDRDFMVVALEKLVSRIAEETGKKVELDAEEFQAAHIPPAHRKQVRDVLVQLAQNAVFHGIEKPDARRQAGKREAGVLAIRTTTENGRLVVSFRDDGKGIDLNLLKERARKSGRYTEEKLASLSGTDAMKLMFDVGISSASDEPNQHAGRGVGMDLVRRAVRELGGNLKVLFRSGSYCEFRFSIPT